MARPRTRIAALAAGLLAIGSAFVASSATAETVKAFPGAEGFGTDTPGGRGGVVCKVTNLDDSGPGSLRACVNMTGPRYVIFKTGGTIELLTRLDIANPFITIAGQTAPGDGITLRMKPNTGTDQGVMKIDTHDVVIRYLRFRPGDGGAADDSHDALAAYKEGGGSYNIVLDHNSFSWAVDENVNIYYDVDNYTISNSIISEALSHAGHPEGEHSKGMLIGGGSTDASLHHNLFISNKDRSPQVSGVAVTDIRNNVVYNYGTGSGSGVTLISSSKGIPKVNWIGNYYKPGPDSDPARAEFATYNGDTGASHQWYGADNKRWTSSGDADARLGTVVGRVTTPFAAPAVTTTTAAQAYVDVLATAGASRVRDAVDQRLIADVKNGTGSIIDSPSEVGGWPTLNPGTPPADGDNDGVPNAFEVEHGMDTAVDDATGDKDGDGYTNVEEWANSLAGDVDTTPEPDPDPTPDPTPVKTPAVTDNADPDAPCGTISVTLSTGANDTEPSVFDIDYENADATGTVTDTVTVQPGGSQVWEHTFAEDYSGGMVDVNFSANGAALVQHETPTDCAGTTPPPDPEPEPEPTPVTKVTIFLNGQLECPVVTAPAAGESITCTYK